MDVTLRKWATPFQNVKAGHLQCRHILYDAYERSIEIIIEELKPVIENPKELQAVFDSGKAVEMIKRHDSRCWKIFFEDICSFKNNDESYYTGDARENYLFPDKGACPAGCYVTSDSVWFDEFWIEPHDETFPMEIYLLPTANDIIKVMVNKGDTPVISEISH